MNVCTGETNTSKDSPQSSCRGLRVSGSRKLQKKIIYYIYIFTCIDYCSSFFLASLSHCCRVVFDFHDSWYPENGATTSDTAIHSPPLFTNA